ncbi:acyl-ACP desaturase [Williamsia sp. CHRR-6]|uniref:acyl-ACP desaturase n=1 Tax=Williamsia sp. CHRR-6 TaxID=2835871 RepID=UPI001BD97473|nr:acyl-ACP desaturase [Williamsia sp. CHRR-6]MBT0566724.1 acyl-ACP desaturase [Williamsia sp. CHRR-6]
MVLEKALPEIALEHEQAYVAWNPHDLVPWDEGRNFGFLGGTDWSPKDSHVAPRLRAALLALLLTKDNLPSFHRVLAIHFPPFSEWREFVGRWTAEDNRHAIALRDHLVVTRQIDPQVVEDRRMQHVTQGFAQNSTARTSFGPARVLALMAVHELLSNQFCVALAALVDDEPLRQILLRIADDDVIQANTFIAFLNTGLNAQPDAVVTEIAAAVGDADPIGGDIADFEDEYALLGDLSGDAAIDAAVTTLVDGLSLRSLDGLGPQAEAARQGLLARSR